MPGKPITKRQPDDEFADVMSGLSPQTRALFKPTQTTGSDTGTSTAPAEDAVPSNLKEGDDYLKTHEGVTKGNAWGDKLRRLFGVLR